MTWLHNGIEVTKLLSDHGDPDKVTIDHGDEDHEQMICTDHKQMKGCPVKFDDHEQIKGGSATRQTDVHF